MALNCNGHLGHLGHLGQLGHLGNTGDLGHLGHLGHHGHLGHLGHLGYLGNNGNLDPLDPYSHDPAPTDSLPGAFITEMDPTDPGPSEGCYADNSLDPLHTRTLETAYTIHTSQTPRREYHTSQIHALDGHGPTSGILIDALDGHGSLSEIEADTQDRIVTRSYDSLARTLSIDPDIIDY
jgi:Collagen triple helix repeat (20 copies)